MHRLTSRALALAAAALLLHLDVLGVARECVSQAAPAQAQHPEHEGHSAPTSPVQSAPDSQCCDAMLSCALALQLGTETDVAIVLVASPAVPMPGDAMPAVARRAPDPPPPRT